MKNSGLKLQIPEPCHENWNKMSPQAKGRFCDVCSKTVVDFSKFSRNEVISYMAENEGNRVCGRVPKVFLENEPVFNPSVLPEQRMQLSRFAFALMLVFGTALFGYAQGEVHMKGEVSLTTIPPDTLSLKDTIEQNLPLPVIDTIIPDPVEDFDLGIMVITDPEPIPTQNIPKKQPTRKVKMKIIRKEN